VPERHELSGDRQHEAAHAHAAERGPSLVHAVDDERNETAAHEADGNERTAHNGNALVIGASGLRLKSKIGA
jgi:hypothetical protein